MIIQIVVLVLVAAMIIKLVLDVWRSKISLRNFLFWVFVWLALEAIVLFPGIVVSLSQIIGIERAKDLPIYASIIILFYMVFKIGIKIERVEQEITGLVKNIALKYKNVKLNNEK